MASKVPEGNTHYGSHHDWRKIGYDDTYEDAQLLHTLQKRLKKEDDPDYEPDLNVDGDSPRQSSTGKIFLPPTLPSTVQIKGQKERSQFIILTLL